MNTRTNGTDRSRRRLLALLLALAILAGGAGAFSLARPQGADRAAAEDTETATDEAGDGAASPAPSPPEGPMTLDVDTGAAPARETVPGIDGEPQPVGRITNPEGTPMDVVLGELVVSYDGDADLDAFLAAVGGEIVDAFEEADPADGTRDALVRLDGSVDADPAEVAAALAAHEDDLAGDWTVSDPSLLPLLHATAVAPGYGVSAIPHGVYDEQGIAEGTTSDGGSPYGSDAFTWPYMASGTAQDVGVDMAWRLLADHGALDRLVPIMVVDQGFRVNDDFPASRGIRRGEWDQPGWGGGSWHGTHVVMAGLAQVDNGVHGAGPAGPVAQLIAVEDAGTSWGNVRSLRRLVDELRPAIVTMSFSRRVTMWRLANQNFYERQFRRIKQDYGALPFASAGNDSRDIDRKKCSGCVEERLVMPCEAKHVACVGGFGDDTTARAVGGCSASAPGSNYGTRTGGRSVEIWGPYFTATENGGRACGTSFATPFVAGVAALVKAADPSLGPDGIWNILKDAAHDQGDIGPEVTGHQRRINAGDAVARALGAQIAAPTISIQAPSTGTEVAHGEWIDFSATATDYRGESLPVTWTSSIDGKIAGPTTLGTGSDSLSAGDHTITATATDGLGSSAGTGIGLTVLDPTPDVRILSPDSGATMSFAHDLLLSGLAEDARGDTLPDEDVRWTFTRAGTQTPVAALSGRFATLPGGTLPPGAYQLTLSGTVAGAADRDTVTVTLVPPQPGQEPPVIVTPEAGSVAGAGTDNKAPVQLAGYALDAGGEKVSGTQLRWTARSELDEDTEIVLCAGTHTPGSGASPGGGFVAGGIDCSEAQAELFLEKVGGSTTWTVTLEVYEGGVLRGEAQTAVVVHLAVG